MDDGEFSQVHPIRPLKLYRNLYYEISNSDTSLTSVIDRSSQLQISQENTKIHKTKVGYFNRVLTRKIMK